MTITRLDITKGLPKGEQTLLYVLQMVSEETLPCLEGHGKNDHVVAPSQDLGARCQDHQTVHLGDGNLMCP